MEVLTLGEKIKRRRKSLKLTLKDVAGDYVTPAQLSYIESGKCKPSDSLLKHICEKIGLDPDYVAESETQQAEKYCKHYLEEYEYYSSRNDIKEAQKRLEQVEKTAYDYGLDEYLGIILYKKGLILAADGDNHAAQHSLLTALQFFIKMGDRKLAAECCCKLGAISGKMEYYNEALMYFTNALNNIEVPDSTNLSYMVYIGIAETYFMMGAVGKAVEILEGIDKKVHAKGDSAKAHKRERKVPYIDELAGCTGKVGQDDNVLLLKLIKYLSIISGGIQSEGISHIKSLLNEYQDGLSPNGRDYLLKAAELLIDFELPDLAENIINMVSKNISDTKQKAVYFYLKAKLNAAVNPDEAMKYIIECIKLIERTDSRSLSVNIRTLLYQMCMDNKCPKAVDYLTSWTCMTDLKDTSFFKELTN